MCGIAGIYNLDQRPVDQHLLVQMTRILRHRGPDDEGFFVEGNVGFGHRRLSIIDTSEAGHQPMSNRDQTIWITYNGEIYNYIELMEELKSLGYRFSSRCDTEVILYAYEAFGFDCVKKFNGMWAFALWDARTRTLFCSRDRMGVKPFYYYFDGQSFVFASEIKAILRYVRPEPDEKVIYNYLLRSFGFMDIHEGTFFKNIKRLRPSHNLTLSGGIKLEKYWEAPLTENHLSEEENIDRFRELLIDSVRLRLRSDVKVAGSLSGGMDSSSITCIVHKILRHPDYESYSVCFEQPEFDERAYVEEVVKDVGCRSHYVFPKAETLAAIVSKILWYQDEPFFAGWVHSQWYLYEQASRDGVKVLLNGHGGDELLGGYYPHFEALFASYLSSGKLGRLLDELKAFHGRQNGYRQVSLANVLRLLISHHAPEGIRGILPRVAPKFLDREFVDRNKGNEYRYEVPEGDILKRVLYESLFISPIPGMLHFDDRNSMAFSIESRVPFLDYRLVEFAFSIPTPLVIKNGLNKYVLRKSMESIIPSGISSRCQKKGFQSAAPLWFREQQRDFVLDLFASLSFKERGYFHVQGVLRDFERHCKSGVDISERLWSWICLELWFRKFIDRTEGNMADKGKDNVSLSCLSPESMRSVRT